MENGDLCGNCGCSSFVLDYERGDAYCEECGCCDEARLQKDAAGFKETHDEHGGLLVGACVYETGSSGATVTDAATERAVASKTRHNSPPYRRATYWSERISQWRMVEPNIDAADLQLISDKWAVLTGKYFNPAFTFNPHFPAPVFEGCVWERDAVTGVLRCSYVIDKEDCRQLLWAIDEDINSVGDRKPFFV